MRLFFLFTFILLTAGLANAQDLEVIEQDFVQAMASATQKDKLIFIDFYTTWCGPCKKLDKLIFKNESMQQELGKDFVLLKYNAENDTVFHLSKKYHINSYPTGLILNSEGYLVAKKQGFAGNDFSALSQSVKDFTNEAIALNQNGTILKGYSNKIDASVYPPFYVDYVNRTNTKPDESEINDYFATEKDIFSEQYFSTLLYFASSASDDIAKTTLENRSNYQAIYGDEEVGTLLYFLASSKFGRATEAQSQEKFDEAVTFAENSLSQADMDDILPYFERENPKAQNKWGEVLGLYTEMKANGEFDNGYINHIGWEVYKKCDDQKVIKQFIDWMKVVTDEEPTYDFLDTYAFLLYKVGNASESKKVAALALAAAKAEERSTKSIEALIAKL